MIVSTVYVTEACAARSLECLARSTRGGGLAKVLYNFVDEAYERTLALLADKQEQLAALAGLLIEHETINHDDIVNCLGARPFDTNKQYDEFITARAEVSEDADGAPDAEADAEEDLDAPPPGEKVDGVPLSPA